MCLCYEIPNLGGWGRRGVEGHRDNGAWSEKPYLVKLRPERWGDRAAWGTIRTSMVMLWGPTGKSCEDTEGHLGSLAHSDLALWPFPEQEPPRPALQHSTQAGLAEVRTPCSPSSHAVVLNLPAPSVQFLMLCPNHKIISVASDSHNCNVAYCYES